MLRLQTRVLGLFLSLGATILVARYLSKAEFGQLALVIALITIVSGVSELGLAGVGVREWVRRDPADRRELLANILGLRLVTIAIGTVLALLIVVLAGYGREVAIGMTVAMVGVAFNAMQGALVIPLIVQLRQGMVGVLELVSVAIQALLQAVLALAGAGVIPLAAALIPAGMASMFATLLVLRGQAPWPRFRWEPLKALLIEAAPFAAAGAVSIVYLRVTVLMGPAFLNEDEFGSFSVAFRAVEPLTMLPAVLTGALFPLLTHAALHDRARLARGYDMFWRSATALGAFSAAGVIGVAPLITLVFTGERSAITVDSLAVLGVALGALFVGSAGMWMLLADRRYGSVLLINLGALIVNVVLTVVAGLWLGAHWFAIGIVAAELTVAIAADRVARDTLRRGGYPAPAPRPLQLVGVVGAVGAAIAVFAVTRDLFPLVPLLGCTAAAAIVLGITRSVPAELIQTGRDAVLRILRRGAPGVAR